MSSLLADECPAILDTPEETKTFGELRVRAIRGWDKLITWALTPQNRSVIFATPPDLKTYHLDASSLVDFNTHYGYFSIYHPIVGIVTESDRDIEVTKCLLKEMGQQIQDRKTLRFASDEVLSKLLAYRDLKKGMKVTLAVSKAMSHTFIVDEVIDLWHGMPAFGLVPETKNGVVPILLFRGTDLDLTSEKGWASILSDLDTSGPGHVTFLRARGEIHQWLKKAGAEYEPPRVMGFSLGGVFVLYSMIYEGDLLNKSIESVAFNPPGVSKEVLNKWEALSDKTPHITYINQGDFVSTIGFFLSDVWELSLPNPMGVIQAHVTLISAQPEFSKKRVDVEKENKSRE